MKIQKYINEIWIQRYGTCKDEKNVCIDRCIYWIKISVKRKTTTNYVLCKLSLLSSTTIQISSLRELFLLNFRLSFKMYNLFIKCILSYPFLLVEQIPQVGAGLLQRWRTAVSKILFSKIVYKCWNDIRKMNVIYNSKWVFKKLDY